VTNVPDELPSACNGGDVAVFETADVIFDAHVGALCVYEPSLPIRGVVFGIVHGDDVLELGGAGL
jgi:hypothetical protein